MAPRLDWMFSTMERIVGPAADGGDPEEARAAFDRFLDNLRRTADLVEREGMPTRAIDRADGYRNVLMTLHFAVDRVLGQADPYAPSFGARWPSHLFDWGGAAPDAVYRSARLAGNVAYRFHGTLGNCRTTSLQFFDGQDICLTIEPKDFARNAAGEIEVFVGGPEREGAWFAAPDGVTFVLLREFFDDWATAEPSKFQIEAVGSPPSAWPSMGPDRVARELDALGEWVHLTAKFWADRLVAGFKAHPNGFTDFLIRDPGVPAISWGYFDVPPGQAWIMEMPVPETPYWSVQPGTIWWRTLDFANRHSSLNNAQVKIDADGMFRAVFAHEDPGVTNWIDLQGISRGAALVRIAEPKPGLATPTGRLVAIEDIDRELPHAVRISAGERQAVIDARRQQVNRLLID